MTAAGTGGGCGTLTWLFSDVKAIVVVIMVRFGVAAWWKTRPSGSRLPQL